MPINPPIDPTECFELSVFGVGPFPSEGAVIVCPPHPHGGGYGNSTYSLHAYGDGTLLEKPWERSAIKGGYGESGYGGAQDAIFSYGPYGGIGPFPKRYKVDGGYGGDPYGLSPYGSVDTLKPTALGAISLDGFHIEIFFSEAMLPNNALLSPDSYLLVAITAAAPATVLSVAPGLKNPDGNLTSVIVKHTGTTLGGTYKVRVTGPVDISGTVLETSEDIPEDPANPFNPAFKQANEVVLYAKGDAPSFTIDVLPKGNELLLSFEEGILPSDESPVGSSGPDSFDAYGFTSIPEYPIGISVTGVQHPFENDDSKILLNIKGMTSLEYNCEVSPSTVVKYSGGELPSSAEKVSEGTSLVSDSTLILSHEGDTEFGWNFFDANSVVVPSVPSQPASAGGSTYRADFEFSFDGALYDGISLGGFNDLNLAMFTVDDGGVSAEIHLHRVAGIDYITVSSGTLSRQVVANWSVGINKVSLVRNEKSDSCTLVFTANSKQKTIQAGSGTIERKDGEPLASFAIEAMDGAGAGSGHVGVLLKSSGLTLSGFELHGLKFTATNTIFSKAWNFLHGINEDFFGIAKLTRDWLLTDRGPLVKGWGDATPATRQDVSVTVIQNGASEPLQIKEVNPYIGKVFLDIPVPLLPPGDAEIEVDYQWFASPVMLFEGLNTEGLVLNKWDQKNGHHSPAASPEPHQQLPDHPKGAPDIHRFPMGVAIGPVYERREPIYIGHRYMGFEKAYTASLNSPTTLLLNQNPHATQVSDFELAPEGVSFFYEGVGSTPSESGWSLSGVDSGSLVGDGTYNVIDETIGDYAAGVAAVYYKEENFSFPSSATLVTRFYANETPSNLDGVFSGIGFGIHDNLSIYLVGGLIVDGVEHIGFLKGEDHREIESWSLAFSASSSILDYRTISIFTKEVPIGIEAGYKIQILEGSQKGVYEIEHLVHQTDGTTTITVVDDFPENPGLWGNKYPTVYFESRWIGYPATYRLVLDPDQSTAELYISGDTSSPEEAGVVRPSLQIDVSLNDLQPADSNLLLPFLDTADLNNVADNQGQVFWGSLSKDASNNCIWSFFRYGVIPDLATFHSRGIVVSTEMQEVPDLDPNSEWFTNQNFGYAEAINGELASPVEEFSGWGHKEDGSDTLVLKSTSASDSHNLTFGYTRIETFYDSKSNIDVDSRVALDFQTLGCSTFAVVNDTQQEVRVGAILYAEGDDYIGSSYRGIVNLPSVSINGLSSLQDQSWETTNHYYYDADGNYIFGLKDDAEGHSVVTTQASGQEGIFYKKLDLSDALYAEWYGFPGTDLGGRLIEARVRVDSCASAPDGRTGIIFGASAGGTWDESDALLPKSWWRKRKTIGLTFLSSPNRVAFTSNGSPIKDYEFNWGDGLAHTYRIWAGHYPESPVTLLIDGIPVLSLGYESFEDSDDNITTFSLYDEDGASTCFFGAYGKDSRSTVEWESFNVSVLAPPTCKRTIGVWLGGDKNDINSWELPRIDATPDFNSEEHGPDIIEMDWREPMEVRIHRDPTWGVTILRPDLPPPPYWDGVKQKIHPSKPESPNLPGGDFSSEITDPSAGWINVEQSQIPHRPSKFGFVSFGSLDSESIAQQRWDWVRYRIYNHPTEEFASPHHMILNQANVITSGEYNKDKAMEVVEVVSLDSRTASLKVTHIYADRVYNVVDGDTLIPNEQWEFDEASQTIYLMEDGEGNEVHFSSEHAPITVTFTAGKPVTNTYLLNQPLLDGQTILNEGTPPVPKNQVGDAIREIIFGSKINDSKDTLSDDPDFILNDPYRTVTFRDGVDTRYEEGMEFYEVKNEGEEGLISSICEGFLPDGFSGLSVEEGEDVFNSSGDVVGKTGKAVGSHVLDLKGSLFSNSDKHLDFPKSLHKEFQQGGGMPSGPLSQSGGILMASGGDYVSHYKDEENNKVITYPLGGHLGHGTAVTWPVYPSKGVLPGSGHGKIYRRTDWYMRFKPSDEAIITSIEVPPQEGASTIVGYHNLTETFGSLFEDNAAPAFLSKFFNPDNFLSVSGMGTALAVMSGAESANYSHIGPWGGLDALLPAADSLLIKFLEQPAVDDSFSIVDATDSSIGLPLLGGFTFGVDVNIGANVNETASNLADAINSTASGLSDKMIALPNGPEVTLVARTSMGFTPPSFVQYAAQSVSGGASSSRVVLKGLPFSSEVTLFAGGAKINQGSLLYGYHPQLQSLGVPESGSGMVLQGGNPLPSSKPKTIFLQWIAPS